MKLSVKVIPNSAKDQIVGWIDGRLKIKVSAQPEKGKANKAVIKLLTTSLNISGQNFTLISGDTNTLKVFEIENITDEQLHQRLGALFGS